jgi:tetratricopeptide (TPR) repeat protein
MTPEEERHWLQVGAQAQELARAGRLPEAEACARSIPDAGPLSDVLQEKIFAFEELGRALFRAGHRERAPLVLAEAERMARRREPGAEWDDALTLFDLGVAWRESGNVSEATRLWDEAVEVAKSGRDTRSLLARIARSLHVMGYRDKALKVARLRPSGLARPRPSDA